MTRTKRIRMYFEDLRRPRIGDVCQFLVHSRLHTRRDIGWESYRPIGESPMGRPIGGKAPLLYKRLGTVLALNDSVEWAFVLVPLKEGNVAFGWVNIRTVIAHR